VEPSLRPLSMAISTVAIHIFGNVPSSPLFGVVQVVNNPSSFSSPILEESKPKCYIVVIRRIISTVGEKQR